MSIDVLFVLGTRPEIIKLSPVIHACRERNLEFSVVHTGQHYSEKLDEVFFQQLDLPAPEYNLEVGSAPHGEQTGEMLARVEQILFADDPEVVLVQGDTNSTLAGALAAAKQNIPVGHIEAGLRSHNEAMPEETNRVIVDHVSTYAFAPTAKTSNNLAREDISEDRIFVTGNTVVDAVNRNLDISRERSDVLSEFDLSEDEYALMTVHRAENTDDATRFVDIFEGIAAFADETGLRVVYPVHPRARDRIEEFDIDVPRAVELIPPQDYLDFLRLQDAAAVVFTDSGGVQEEACIMQVPCVTLRNETERPETLDVGSNVLAGTEAERIVTAGKNQLSVAGTWENPFGDGTSSEQIIDIVTSSEHAPSESHG